MSRPEGFQHYKDYGYEDYSYSESDSDSSSDCSPSLPPFQLPKARMDENWLRDKRVSRRCQYGISRGHIKPADSSSLSTIQSNISSLLESTNEEDDLSDLYTPVQKGEKPRVPPVFSVPEELSPVLGSSIDGPPCVPSLRLQRDWRPQQTSTSTSFQPFISTLPKTNPHHAPKFVSSTPRVPTSGRIPMYSYNQIIEGASRPSSYCGEDSCEFPSSSRSQVENVKPTFYRPENFGLPTGVAKNVGSEGIVFLSMTLCGNQLNVSINEAVYFQDPYQPQVSSYVRVEMRRRCGNSRKRYYREKIQSYKTRNWLATNRPTFNEKFTFYIDEDNYFRDLLTISVYKLKVDNHQQRMRMLGCMTFPVKRLMKKAREANDGYYIDENMTMDEVVVNEGGFFLLSPKRGEKKSFPQNKISIKTYYNDKTFSGDGALTTSSSCISNPSEVQVLSRKLKSAITRREESSSGLVAANSHVYDGAHAHRGLMENITNSYEEGYRRIARSDGSLELEPYLVEDAASAKLDRNGGDVVEKSSIRIRVGRVDEKFGGIFGSFSGSFRRSPRVTMPDISTTTETTSDADASIFHLRQRVPKTQDRPSADDSYNIHKQRTISTSSSDSRKEQRVRRTASFTFSPKGAADKNNRRVNVNVPQEREEREDKKKLFGPISKTISLIRNKLDVALSTSSLYPSRDDVQQWRSSFESLLNHKYGCSLFREFLKKEFSDENVDFWLECEEFKKMKEGKKATIQKAQEIFNEFVAPASPKEVNLDSDTRAATKAAMESGCKTDTFSLAQSRIEQLMAKDSYRRFLKDPLYLTLATSLESGENCSKISSK